MKSSHIFDSIAEKKFFLVGIKGSGMCALAELLHKLGAEIIGSDSDEVFYTDAILRRLNITVFTSFAADLLPDDCDAVIHSAAYDRRQNPQLVRSERSGLPVLSYPEALGLLSRAFFSCAIAGVHGKTTTTAIAGNAARFLDLPASVIVGSAVNDFLGSSVLVNGDKFLIAETCEYRRHFLHYQPSIIVLTSVEPDHLDCYPTYAAIETAFVQFAADLPAGGELIFCADNSGAAAVAEKVKKERQDIRLTSYGKTDGCDYQLKSILFEEGKLGFQLTGVNQTFTIPLPGEHIALNCTAVIALMNSLIKKQHSLALSSDNYQKIADSFTYFKGVERRSEKVGEINDIIIIDDYAHHPTAIKTTLQGLRKFYPGRRLIVDFMSHTYSRTAGLLVEFAASFDSADIVIINKIYSSAREIKGEVDGKTLYNEVKKKITSAYYFHEPEQAKEFCLSTLQPGDLFVTLGAGDNWRLGKELLSALTKIR